MEGGDATIREVGQRKEWKRRVRVTCSTRRYSLCFLLSIFDGKITTNVLTDRPFSIMFIGYG
jgi:hypothetical protein